MLYIHTSLVPPASVRVKTSTAVLTPEYGLKTPLGM